MPHLLQNDQNIVEKWRKYEKRLISQFGKITDDTHVRTCDIGKHEKTKDIKGIKTNDDVHSEKSPSTVKRTYVEAARGAINSNNIT